MGRRVEQRRHALQLDQLAGVHHGDAAGALGQQRQVVGDEQQRHVLSALQLHQQLQHLGLHGHVQRSGGLIGNQQLGRAGQRDGDHHPLAHAAGELVRVGTQPRLGIGHLDQAQQLQRALAQPGLGPALVDLERLDDLEADGVARVQAGHRVLEDHRDVAAGDAAALAGAEFQQVLTVEAQQVGGDAAGRLHQAHQRQHGHALAGAGFADDAEQLAALDVQVQALDGGKGAVLRAELDGEVADLEKTHGAHGVMRGA